VELPRELYDKLDKLVPGGGFVDSWPAIFAACSATLAAISVGVTVWLAMRQYSQARERDLESDKRKAAADRDSERRKVAVEAGDALQTLHDALLDISDDRKSGKAEEEIDLTAYRAAHAATRHAMLKRLAFDKDGFVRPFDGIRDTASRYAYNGDRDRSHPDLAEFNSERTAYDEVLRNFIAQPNSAVATTSTAGEASESAGGPTQGEG
jgi:hypothetical protein